MTVSLVKAKKTALAIRRAKRNFGTSYRAIEREGLIDGNIIIQPGVNNTVISLIAKTKGQWLPKDEAILKRLGLIKPRKPRTIKRIEDLSRDELIERRHRLALKLEQIDMLIGERI